MGSGNGGLMTDLASTTGGRSQHNRASRRPPRACTARTPSRLAPVAPTVERSTPSRKQQRAQHGRPHAQSHDPPFTPMALTSPPSPSQKDRWLLRSMWEMASIVHFLNVFRPVLKMKVEFSFEELESALLAPNALLDDVHITLLKAIPPISRSPMSSETWVGVLCKKMKDRWHWVAEGSFPLAPYHGEEKVTYNELDPDVRVVILKALCEARLENDDIRVYMDEMLKQGAPLSNIRKERTGTDMQGTTYWYENDPVAGQRFYRELRRPDAKDKPKVRGRLMPPPSAGQWETLATNLDEFLTVADKLCQSRNRLEVAIGKRLNNDIIPDLQDLQKKKERALKKQQRQAVLLNSYLSTEVLTGGRSKRERKPVTYTFDDYDRSISEAIKITKRRNSSPSPELSATEGKNVANGSAGQRSDDEVDEIGSEDVIPESETGIWSKPGTDMATQSNLGSERATRSKGIDARSVPPKRPRETVSYHSSESEESSDAQQFGRRRRLRRPRRYAESDFVDDMAGDNSSEEDIEGEAVYDDDYASTKKGRAADTSDGDDEYRGEEDEEDDDDVDLDEDVDDDEEDEYMASSDDGEDAWKARRPTKPGRGRTRAMSKALEKPRAGLRRSQRATRSHVDYSKYEDSDMEGDEEDLRVGRSSDEDLRIASRSPNRADSELAATLASSPVNGRGEGGLESEHTRHGVGAWEESSTGGQPWDDCDPVEESYNPSPKEAVRGMANGVNYEPQAEVKPETKVHRFLDLNVAAPLGGGPDDMPAGCSKDEDQSPPFMVDKFESQNQSLLFTVDKFESSDEDESNCESPKDWTGK